MSELHWFGGQSNMSGFGMSVSTLPTHLNGWSSPRVQVWNATTQAFEAMVPGVNTGNNGMWSSPVQYGYRWVNDSANDGQTLFLVITTKGETDIYNDPAVMDWSPASGELFANAVAQVNAAKLASGISDVAGIHWMLGETASYTQVNADSHQGLLTDQFAAFRAQIGDADTPIFFGRVNDDLAAPHLGTVRTAQQNVDAADGNAFLIDTDANTLQSDKIHWSAGDHIAFGDAQYDLRGAPRNIQGTSGNDTLIGGTGNDTVHGRIGDDLVQGGKGNDLVYGGQGNDTVRGGAGDDHVFGDKGNDFISGDKGNDTMTGGEGADTFNFGVGMGTDRIEDFNLAQGDQLRIEGGAYIVSHLGGSTIVTMTDTAESITLWNTLLDQSGAGWIVS